ATDTIDPTAQMKLLQKEVDAGSRSLSFSMPFGEFNTDPLGSAAGKGVQLIELDTPPLPGWPVNLYVGNDNHDLGRLLADTVADKPGAGALGKIVLASPRNGVPQLDARALGFRERMRERLPQVRVVGPLDTADQPGAAVPLWETLAKSNADAIAFVSVGANAA